MKILLLFCLAILLSCSSNAEQLKFSKQTKSGRTHFNYRWNDHDGNARDLKFYYRNKVLFNHFRNFKGYQAQRAKRDVLRALEKAAAKVDSKKVSINFIERKDSIEIELASRDQELRGQVYDGLMQIRAQTEQEFLHKQYYNLLTDKFGRTGIKPDHVRISKESIKDIRTISAAFMKTYPKMPIRQTVSIILSFVQSIPYSTLQNRRLSNGAGFSPPLKLINNNQGDCDSKVTLMASILSAIYPRMSIAIIYLPDHALIGMQVPNRNEELTLNIDGRTMLLAEPTGPAMLPLGEIAERSEFFINGQQFSYERF